MGTNNKLLTTIREALDKSIADVEKAWQRPSELYDPVEEERALLKAAKDALAALDQLEAHQADIGKLVDEVSNTVQAVVAAFERKCGLSEYSDKNKSLVKSMRDAADALLYGTYTAAKSAAPAQQQPKRLTDEEIKAEMMRYDESLEQNTNFDVTEVLQMGTAYGAGMRYARDNGYLGGLSVEEVMSEVHEALVAKGIKFSDKTLPVEQDLRARLTAKLQGK
jgi:hypothetical protein